MNLQRLTHLAVFFLQNIQMNAMKQEDDIDNGRALNNITNQYLMLAKLSFYPFKLLQDNNKTINIYITLSLRKQNCPLKSGVKPYLLVKSNLNFMMNFCICLMRFMHLCKNIEKLS